MTNGLERLLNPTVNRCTCDPPPMRGLQLALEGRPWEPNTMACPVHGAAARKAYHLEQLADVRADLVADLAPHREAKAAEARAGHLRRVRDADPLLGAVVDLLGVDPARVHTDPPLDAA